MLGEDTEYSNLPVRNFSEEQHLASQGVSNYIQYPHHKVKVRNFQSDYIFQVAITALDPRDAKEKAILRIEQVIEALTISTIGIERRIKGKIRNKHINDIYQYQFLGVYIKKDKSFYKLKSPMLMSGVNFFPEKLDATAKVFLKDIIRCNEQTVLKATKYLKRAKEFSYEYHSDIEIFLNSIKCIELICIKFYKKGKKIRNSKGKMVTMNMKDKIKAVAKRIFVSKEYEKIAIDAWDSRNISDFAHASEYKLLPLVNAYRVNEAAYLFVSKYIMYLKINDPYCFWDEHHTKNDDWWNIFR